VRAEPWLSWASGAAILLSSASAAAYCRTTTCDVNDPDVTCERTDDGCAIPDATDTFELYWPSGCSWWGVQKDGSAKRQISYDSAHTIIGRSLARWLDADCGGAQHPAVALEDTDALFGPVECSDQEFNKKAANANAWIFRDTDWPYQGQSSTLALTTVTVSMRDGRMLDADVEINSFAAALTDDGTNGQIDLEAITTHEAGHFLGLAHSPLGSSTMFASYSGVEQQSLEADDVQGICAIYPPGSPAGCEQPSPLYGFSLHCGGVDPEIGPAPSARNEGSSRDGSCSVGVRATSAPRSLASTMALALVALAARRRRRTA